MIERVAPKNKVIAIFQQGTETASFQKVTKTSSFQKVAEPFFFTATNGEERRLSDPLKDKDDFFFRRISDLLKDGGDFVFRTSCALILLKQARKKWRKHKRVEAEIPVLQILQKSC